MLLTRNGENYAIPSCPIVIYDKTPELVSDYPVLAHPTGIRGQIQIDAQSDGFYHLYTLTGQRIASGAFYAGEPNFVYTNGTQTCYLLRLSTPSHGLKTLKLFVP